MFEIRFKIPYIRITRILHCSLHVVFYKSYTAPTLKYFFLLLLLLPPPPLVLIAQQTAQFSNYLFNGFGINPAAVSRSRCYEIKFGRREQWAGFGDGPVTTFVSATHVFGNKKQRNNYHAAGLYFEQDGNNSLKTEGFYPGYSYHLRVYRDYFASFGAFAGARRNSLSAFFQNDGDPAFQKTGGAYIFPDISLGLRLSSKEVTYDFAIKQIYNMYIVKKFGTPSRLSPSFYFTYIRKIEAKSFYYTYIPSFQVRYGWNLPPSVDLSFMMFIKGKMGYGLSYRYNDALTGLFHIKLKNKFTIALAFDYILSGMRAVTFHSREYMAGISICPLGDRDPVKTYCPAYEN